MQDLRVTLIQSHLHWEDVPANLAHFGSLIDGIGETTDLVVLPEMFTTGFSMVPQPLAENMQGPSVQWLLSQAKARQCHILGSAIIEESGCYCNRLLWACPDGQLHTYDKKHLFRMAGEHQAYVPGHRHLTVEVKGWKLRPFICYDLRFPLWCRNFDLQYDAAIFVANWPQRRSAHWKLLLQARAVENQCFVLGVNRIGQDGYGVDYSGDSSVIDPMGNVLFSKAVEPCVKTVLLEHEPMRAYRESFTAWRDADRELVSGLFDCPT